MFDVQSIYAAYRRFKNYCYYDNSNLFYRLQIAEFEEKQFHFDSEDPRKELSKVFQPISDLLNSAYDYFVANHNSLSGFSMLDNYLKDIDCYVVPKEVEQDNTNKAGQFITNRISNDPVGVKSCNYLIKAPIEIHIISVLWIEIVGIKLSSHISDYNYAYQLNTPVSDLDEKTIDKNTITLFRPYFLGYKDWRDNALKEAKRLMETGSDVTMLSLDVKRYFYSVRVNVPQLIEPLLMVSEDTEDYKQIFFLDALLQRIHEAYQERIEPYLDNKTTAENSKRHETVLPVGLLSSGILANLYLSRFDRYVVQKTSPSYYGRYVDDMIFVFKNKEIADSSESQNPVDEFINEYFCSVGVLMVDTSVGNDTTEKAYIVNATGSVPKPRAHLGNLRIQSEKVILEHFDHRGSHAAIDIFMRNLSRNRSEFRFLPDEDSITAEFDNEAYQLQYDGSINKFRSMQDFKKDKYGAAKYLAQQIFLSSLYKTESKLNDKAQKEKVAHQLLTFFTGSTAVSMYMLWERVATYFVLNDDLSSLVKFYHSIYQIVSKLQEGSSVGALEIGRLQEDLYQHLELSVALPLALLSKSERAKLDGKFHDENRLNAAISKLRHSNMFRISNVGLLGVNLTKSLRDDAVSLLSDNLSNYKSFDVNKLICYLTPKCITFEELNMLEVCKTILSENLRAESYKTIESLYSRYNMGWSSLLCEPYYEVQTAGKILEVKDGYISIHDHDIVPKNYEVNKKIAIVNKKVLDTDFMSVVKYGKALNTSSRRQELIKIFNDAFEQKSDMLVMPELTVPFGLLGFLAKEAKKTNMAIVTGLEYCVYNDGIKKNIKNYVATILPFTENYIKGSFIHLREKNFYSPKEEMMLDGYHYNFKKYVSQPQYNLFHWRKSYFSVYNCFELADISSRSKFMSKVDFVIAVEFNKDVHYFSDVVGSWARDLHCFIVQVNSSHFGNSKIVMPSKTDEKTLVQVKGGDNTVILVAKMPIEDLRDFQLGTYVVQQDDKRFKFTPPGFDHDMALKRHNDEEVY